LRLNKTKLFYLFLLLQPFLDLITSLMTRFLNFPITIGVIIRGIFLVLIVIYTLLKTKKDKKLSGYLLSVFIFGCLYFLTKIELLKIENLITELIYLFKYFYFPIVVVCLLKSYNKLQLDKNIINKIFIFDAAIYAVLIILPVITNTSFSSYGYYGKGSVGWFYAANEIGAILSILFPFIYIKLHEEKIGPFFVLNIILSLSMMIIGTKVCYLAMIFTQIFFLIYFILTKRNRKIIITSALVIVISLIAIPTLPVSENVQTSIDNNITTEIEQSNDTNLYSKVINIILSSRQIYLSDTYEISKKSPVQDKLFGIGFSNRNNINDEKITKLIEIDFLDILFHYGLIGFIVYFLPFLYIIIKSFIKIIKKKQYTNFYKLIYMYLTLLLISISSVAGHVFGSPSVSIYLSLVFVLLSKERLKNKKLKEDEITILALHLNYGGVEQYISSLCKMLEKKYKINIVATYKILDKPAFYFSDKINITYLIEDKPNKEEFKLAIENKNVINIFKEGLKSIKILLLRKIKNIEAIGNIDSKYIITTRYFHNNLVGNYANKNTIKIATEHNYHNNNSKYIKKVISSVNNFDYFVLVSNNLKEFYENKVKCKCLFIPNVIESLPNKFTSLNENNIINIGRLEQEKGQSDLIDIVYELKKEIKDLKLYLIGDGSLRKVLEKKAKSLNLEDTVIFTGFISKEEMEKYLIKSKLFIMTSFTESFGIVLLEAMSYKVPCIAYDSADGAKELLFGNNGILIKDRNKKEMINTVKKLLNDKKELEKISLLSYNHCKEYLISNVENKWLDLLK